MPKKSKKATKTTEKVNPKAQEVPEGFEEVGDHWDEMFMLSDETPEIMGIYRQTADNIGEFKSKVHILNAGSSRIGVWGSTLLDSRMACVTPGNIVIIRYMGVEHSEKSGREYQVYKVFEKKGTLRQTGPDGEDIPF